MDDRTVAANPFVLSLSQDERVGGGVVQAAAGGAGVDSRFRGNDGMGAGMTGRWVYAL